MNLTTPPPVEDLDRADELRADLVRRARQSQHSRPAWVPVLAAACGIAVITTGVVVLTQTSGDDSAPLGSTPSTEATPPDVVPKPINDIRKVPADASARVSLDLGPASRAESLAAARDCLAGARSDADGAHPPGSPGGPPLPAEADTATVHDARWVRTVPGYNRKISPDQRALVQTFTTAKGVWAMCIDNHYQALQKHRRANGSADLTEPVNGQWTAADASGQGPSTFYTDLAFDALPTVARVELRIRWSGGASPWYGVTVKGGAGFVEASQPGARSGEVETDLRAFDASGKQIFSDVEYY
jgi:hypothetical protein